MADDILDLAAGDDTSSAYLAHTQRRSDAATIEAFLRRTAPEPEPQAQQPSGTPSPAPASYINPETGRLRITVTPPKERSLAGRVIGDVAKGITETPGQIAGGFTDAARNAAAGLNNLGTWLNENVADLRIDIPSTGNETADAILRPFLNPLAGPAGLTKVPEPGSMTGQVVREGSRFLAGFVPAMRAMRGVGMTGAVTTPLAAGAVSDFVTKDPNEGGLANFIQSVPELKNPVTEYLATDPDDPEAINRLRHALEGVGLGALAEGVFRGIRVVAAGRKAAQQQAIEAAAAFPEQPVDTFFGPRDWPAVRKIRKAAEATETGVPEDVAAKGLTKAATGESEVYVNFARIETADDVKNVIGDMASAFKGEIDEARRGVQTNVRTKELAEELNMSVEDLLMRRKGQPFNAEQALAARQLMTASAEKLMEAAKLAAAPNAGPADLYNFRRMMAVHQAVQTEVIAARTETARALQSWAIPAEAGGAQRARMIEQLLESSGGGALAQDLALRIAQLGAQGASPAAIAAAVRKGWGAATMNAVREAYITGLLWSPSTHLVNVASNTAVAFQQIYERAAARAVGTFLGTAADNKVVDGEALSYAYGMIMSTREAFRAAGRTVVGEAPDLTLGGAVSKIDVPQRAISSEAIAQARGLSAAEAAQFAETPMGRGLDLLGETVRLPGRALETGDAFFKTWAYRGELHAQALRQATQEGRIGADRFRRMAELVNDPPENLTLSAMDAALYATFQSKVGNFGRAMMGAREGGSLNPTFLVLPFVRTPTNILRYSFERTPLAPLVSQWRDDIVAGGARRDLAIARMATGTMIMLTAMDFASSGLITGAGPKDPSKREVLERAGWQPNSIVVNGKYYSFNRADPMGMLLGFAGTVAEKMKEADHSPEDFDSWEEVLSAGITAVSASVVEKTYLTGMANVFRAIEGSDGVKTSALKWIDRQTGSMLPFSSLSNTMKRFTDPVTREVNSPWDAIDARIAGLSNRLPPARDLWGRERAPQEVYGRLYDVISPVAVRQRTENPIDEEMIALNMGKERIAKRGLFQGAEVNFRDHPEVYDEYVRLAGNDLKLITKGNLGAMDYLNAVVSGRHVDATLYAMRSDGPEGGKAAFIHDTIKQYREAAQEQIMADPRFSDFADFVDIEARKRAAQRFPLGPQIMAPPELPRLRIPSPLAIPPGVPGRQ